MPTAFTVNMSKDSLRRGINWAFLLVLIAALVHPSSADQRPTVDLGYAQYAGVQLSNGVSQFLGMRYGKAPLDDLRFAPPQEPDPEPGVVDAGQSGPVCLGSHVPSNSVFGDSEDCLFLDVYSPSFTASSSVASANLPVYIWISGGGYIQLFNHNYNGSDVIAATGMDIVIVVINYRVGPLGFLGGEAVTKNGSANAGLLDQRLAFSWVQQYIQMFGGNPDHVILDGASAGAGSLTHHLTAYGGRDDKLFVGGISDSDFEPYTPMCSDFNFRFFDFSLAAGCGNTSDQLACLRASDSSVLQKANTGFPFPGRANIPLFPWGPCIDGDIIQDTIPSLLQQGKYIKVPLLYGNDQNEGSIFAPNANTSTDVATFFVDNYPLLTPDDTNAIISQQYAYLNATITSQHGPLFALAEAAYGESTFICPSNLVMDSYASGNCSAPVWNYRYNVLDPANAASGEGVPHTYQIQAWWGMGDPDFNLQYQMVNNVSMPLVRGYWSSFVKHLDPNVESADGAPVWGTWGSERGRLMFGNEGSSMETVPEDQVERCAFWNGLEMRTLQ